MVQDTKASLTDHKYLPIITIKKDGTITPQTEYITQTGKTYTLTGNISQTYTISIECSDIFFDGAGYHINSFQNWLLQCWNKTTEK